MRVEWALIGGIVCFCCWCAYILINMNSTVTIQPTTTTAAAAAAAQVPHQQQQQQQQQQYQYQTNPFHHTNNPQPPPYGLASSAPMAEPIATTTQVANMAQPFPTAMLATQVVGHNFAELAHKQPEAGPTPSGGYYTLGQGKLTSAYAPPPTSGASLPDQAWQNPLTSSSSHSIAATSSNYHPNQHGHHWQPEPPSKSYKLEPPEPSGTNGNYYHQTDDRRGPIGDGMHADQPANGRLRNNYGLPSLKAGHRRQGSGYPGAESPNRPALEEEEQDEEEEEPAQTQSDTETGREEVDQSPQEDEEGDGSSRETIGARSYSENQLEANERDRYGRPIRVHYNHLINGRPVPATSRHRAATDFDSIASELDPDQEQQRDDHEAGQDDYDESIPASQSGPLGYPMQSGESRLAGAARKPLSPSAKIRRREVGSGRSRINNYRKQKGAKRNSNRVGRRGNQPKRDRMIKVPQDSHQHRLSESLKAQQWDDDVVSLPSSKSKSSIKGKQSVEGSSAAAVPPEVVETTTEATTPEEFVNDDESHDYAGSSDLFAGTDKFPFLDSDSDSRRKRKRKRRQVVVEAKEENLNPITPSYDVLARLHSNEHDNHDENDPDSTGDGNRTATTTAAADTLNSLEDLNIHVMTNPSSAGGGAGVAPAPGLATTVTSAGGQQQSLLPAPLPAPPWPPSSTGQHLPQQHQTMATPVSSSGGPHVEDRERYRASSAQNGHSEGGSLQPTALGSYDDYPPSGPIYSSIMDDSYYYPPTMAGGGSSHRPRRRKMKRSKVQGSSKDEMMKYKGAKALKSKKSIKYNKAGMKKAKRKSKNKLAKSSKQFKGSTRGKKGKQGHGHRGSKKGSLYHKDKGYKKRGFKRVYKKMEAGDNKTYFDEFRDKDHNKKWKNSKDKYHYSHNKNWAGNDMKKYKDLNAHSFKDKKMGSGGLKEKSKSNFKHNYKYKDAHSRSKKKKKTN